MAELALKLGENPFGHARLAIAVPKRIVKSAVDRNRVKRAIREQFRQHEIRSSPVDILVTLRHIGLDKPRKHGSIRCQLRKTFAKLLGDISQRFAAPV